MLRHSIDGTFPPQRFSPSSLGTSTVAIDVSSCGFLAAFKPFAFTPRWLPYLGLLPGGITLLTEQVAPLARENIRKAQ